MEFIKKSSEDEMIAVFLKAEIRSPRFGSRITSILNQLTYNINIIESPNINDDKENTMRRMILDEYRSYSKREDFFEDFPEVLKWNWYSLSKNDVSKIKYINYDYWNELSDNTRLPQYAAQNIRAGKEAFGVTNEGFIVLSKYISEGINLEPIILVKATEKEYYVVMEGHARLTAYALNDFKSIDSLKVIVGDASFAELKQWGLY